MESLTPKKPRRAAKAVTCLTCGKVMMRKASYADKVANPTCSHECGAEMRRTLYAGANNPNHSGRTNIESFFHQKSNDCKHRAKDKGLEFNLDGAYLHAMYEAQNGLCAYSGIPLRFKSAAWTGQADFDVVSVDRIDSSKGYIKGNIKLAATAINKLKGADSLDSLKTMLQYIAERQNGGVVIKLKKLTETAVTPRRANLYDAGYDLHVDRIEETATQIKVYTGLAMTPEGAWFLELYPRSSICKKGLRLSNSVGVIDKGYTGEIMAVFDKLDPSATLAVGERFAQVVARKLTYFDFVESEDLTETTRGTGAFGSTGWF